MNTLTPRLQSIADEINKGETVADIGTDHGYLPLYLWKEGMCSKVIMADISRGSLSKAEENCKALFPEQSFDLRLGSGLEVLTSGETDVVVMAGMGGILMTEILEADIEKSWSFKKYILQPRSHIGQLRCWLLNNNFRIINEKLVREGKFICEIIVAVPGEIAVTRQMDENDIEYEFPHNLADYYKNELTCEYLETRLNIEKNILSGMNESSNLEFHQLRRQKYRIEYLEYLLRRCRIED